MCSYQFNPCLLSHDLSDNNLIGVLLMRDMLITEEVAKNGKVSWCMGSWSNNLEIIHNAEGIGNYYELLMFHLTEIPCSRWKLSCFTVFGPMKRSKTSFRICLCSHSIVCLLIDIHKIWKFKKWIMFLKMAHLIEIGKTFSSYDFQSRKWLSVENMFIQQYWICRKLVCFILMTYYDYYWFGHGFHHRVGKLTLSGEYGTCTRGSQLCPR